MIRFLLRSLSLGGLATFLGIGIAVLIARSISRPLKQVEHAAQHLCRTDVANLASGLTALARGDLTIGSPSKRTTELADIFIRAGIFCRISDNIEGELWLKLLCNCALNAISALGNVRYGEIVQNADAKQVMQDIVDEVLAVASAARVVLPGVHDQASGIAAAMEIATQMHGAFSSTAQDLSRGRPTEIEALNGYVARRGMELGISVPVNHTLFTLVKLAEQRKGS